MVNYHKLWILLRASLTNDQRTSTHEYVSNAEAIRDVLTIMADMEAAEVFKGDSGQ